MAVLLTAWALASAATGAEPVAGDVLRTSQTTAALGWQFAPEDEVLLEAVQRGCFNYFWNEVGSPSGLVKDRRFAATASVAGVGFQLASLPIGVEHGWIARDEGRRRAEKILRTLDRDDIRRRGLYLHFVDKDDAGVYRPFKTEISTVDSALLLAGALVAGEYFGGETANRVRRLAENMNWRAYVDRDRDFIVFAWHPADNVDVGGEGTFATNVWHLASDEERLIYFLAAGAPKREFAVDPAAYCRLERHVERHGDTPPYVVSWPGSLFTYFFSHLYIDYRGFDADNPGRFGVAGPRVDWLENSRRATLTHRQRCLDAAAEFPTFGPDRWGVSPCMGFDAAGNATYMVQDVEPNLSNRDAWHGGTIAPYAAGSAIMFTPAESVAALRAFRQLKDDAGQPLVWRDPARGGYALADSFNLDSGKASDDNVAIDAGPLLVAIENARTGLVWRLFMEHPVSKRAVERLRFVPRHD